MALLVACEELGRRKNRAPRQWAVADDENGQAAWSSLTMGPHMSGAEP